MWEEASSQVWKGLLAHSPWSHSLKNLSSLKPSLKNHLLPPARLHQKLTQGFTSVRSVLASMANFVFPQAREAVTINLCFPLLSVVSCLGWRGQSADVTLELVIQYLDSFYREQSRVVGVISGPQHHSDSIRFFSCHHWGICLLWVVHHWETSGVLSLCVITWDPSVLSLYTHTHTHTHTQ